MISKIQPITNFEDLQKEIVDFFNMHSNGQTQVMCQTDTIDREDLSIGTGRIEILEEKNEEKYIHLHKSLINSRLQKIINHYQGFRTRILKLNPRACYSIHKDPTPRIQIPIVSNKQSWMIWPYENVCMNLKEGFLYEVDTTKDHTFINGDEFLERIHLVICSNKIKK